MPDPIPTTWVREIVRRMRTRYGSLFDDMWRGLPAADLEAAWAEELAGFRPDEIRRGLEALKQRDLPPTLTVFQRLCRPPVDHEAAFHEAVAQMAARERGADQWSHPAIYWAAAKIGQHDLVHLGWQQIRVRWTVALDEQMDRGEWPVVPPRMEALPAPGAAPMTREQASAVMADVRAKVALPPSNKVGLAWAHKILQRHADGDHTLPAVSLQFAREALGLPGSAAA